jgi:peptide methionine sulfoxide reductase MsrB
MKVPWQVTCIRQCAYGNAHRGQVIEGKPRQSRATNCICSFSEQGRNKQSATRRRQPQ